MAADRPERRPVNAPLLAAFTAAGWAAVVVAAFGILSLLLDLDVIPQSDAGPLLGPAMVVGAAVVLALLVIRIIRTEQPAGLSFVGATAAVYLALLVLGAIGYTLLRAEVIWLLVFPLTYAVSPFIVAAALLAGIAALVGRSMGARQAKGRPRPRWPWEDPSDE
jgi:hypothetical protein